jgi:hypothetical protein
MRVPLRSSTLLVALLLSSSALGAQSSSSTQPAEPLGTASELAKRTMLPASATIFQPTSLVATRSLRFSPGPNGTRRTVGPDDPGSGRFYVSFDPSSEVQVEISLPTRVVGPSGESILMDGWSAVGGAKDEAGGASLAQHLHGGRVSMFSQASSLSGDTSAHSYFRIGCTSDVLAGREPGVYSATILLVASYE